MLMGFELTIRKPVLHVYFCAKAVPQNMTVIVSHIRNVFVLKVDQKE